MLTKKDIHLSLFNLASDEDIRNEMYERVASASDDAEAMLLMREYLYSLIDNVTEFFKGEFKITYNAKSIDTLGICEEFLTDVLKLGPENCFRLEINKDVYHIAHNVLPAIDTIIARYQRPVYMDLVLI